MTARQLEILQHSLGVDEYGRTPKGFTPYTRNYFCAGAKDEEDCRALVEMGFMQEHRATEWLPYYNVSVTPEGIRAMKAESKPEPKLTRSQKRYQQYLDSDSGWTFKEWLQWRKA